MTSQKQSALLLACLFAVCVGLFAATDETRAADQAPPPEKALQISDPNVVPYAVRARLTRGTWDYLRVVLRDTFKQWGSPRRDTEGINLLLDPGYDYATKSAGPIRTSPFERFWAYTPGFGCTFADCNGNNVYSVRSGTNQWIQVRKYDAPGSTCNTSNTVNGNERGLPDANRQNLHREHGFYISKEGQCYTEIEVCTPGSSQSDISTPHAGHDPMQVCDFAPIDTGIVGIMAEINLGAFVYPHGGIESMRTPLEAYDPPDLGTYTGFSTRYGMRGAGSRTVSTGCNWIGACGGSATGWTWVASGFPAAAGNYDPFYMHHKDTGSYFRQGDDQAVYLNVGQMQVQSLLRAGAANIWYQLKDQQSGLCLAVQGGVTTQDTPIILEACDAAQNYRQMFQYDYVTGYLRSRLGTQTMCVSFQGAYDGAALRLFACGAGDATHVTVFDRPGDKFRNKVDTYAVTSDKNANTAKQQVFAGTAPQQWEYADSGDASSRWQQFKTDYDGTCVDISGQNLVHVACNGNLSQYWIYNPNDQTFRSAVDFNRCMDVEGANYSDGTQVISWPCNGGNNQKWTRTSLGGNVYGIRSVGNSAYCLNADTGGTKVQIYHDGLFNTHCTSGWKAEEKWQMIPGDLAFGWLRDRDGAKCIYVPGPTQANGTAVVIGACVANDYYQWLFDSVNGYIRLKANPNICLDHGANNYPGAPLTIYTCGAGREAAQRFDRQGEFILPRNGFFLSGGANPVTMRYPRTDLSQSFEQINDKSVVITYQPQMHDCGDSFGNDRVYNGTRDGANEPVYFDALTPQCVRPKSYWNATKQRWVQCDPFDTYLADNSFNPARDDNNLIYPAPFGGQTLTCGTAVSRFDPGNSGWYGLKIDDLTLTSDAAPLLKDKNSIMVTISTKDLRFEAGIWLDVNLTGSVSGLVSDPKRRWALINVHAKNLIARPKIKLYSIDSSSCLEPGGGCDGFWYPWSNQQNDPDRLVVDVELTKADIDLPMDNPSFSIVSAPQCFVSVIGVCAMTTENLMGTVMGQLSDVIKGVLIPLIDDAVRGAVDSLPELNTVLGNPMNLNTTLIDVGLYATPEPGAYLADPTLPEPPRKWPVRIFDGPAAGREITDLRLAVGLKPIPFVLPATPSGFVTVDTQDPPLSTSVYGVPNLVDPDTSACYNARGSAYTHTILARGLSYSYNNGTGVMNLSFSAGGYPDLRAGYTIRDVSTGKTATIKSVNGTSSITLTAGLQADFNGNDWEVAIGVMSGMTFTQGSAAILVAGQVFRDDSMNKFVKVVEVRGTSLLVETYALADFNGGNFTVFNCSRPSRYPAVDEDQQVDEDDYLVTGTFTDPYTGKVYTKPQVIPEYWKGPIPKENRAPAWCATPQTLRQDSTPTKMAQLYPQTTWLSFDSTYDKKYSNQAAGPKNTIGGWDQLPGSAVLRQNYNDGSTELNPVTYDFSLHVHQRTIAAFLQALVSSGAACLEFAAQDTTGADTPWKSLLAVDRFAAFIPELATLYPGRYVSLRVYPTRAPHVRTGVGNLSFSPRERLRDPVGGPLPITNEKYTLGVAFPDIRIEFWVQDPASQSEVRVLTMYWNTVLGLFAKNVRKCYKLDPLVNSNECTSTQVNERTVSGYYELFVDMNAPALQTAFENATDGFAAGSFTDDRTIGTAKGQSAIVIDTTICQVPGKCKLIGLSQAVPSLLSAMIQLFFVTRLTFMDMTIDFLYVGADGPSDDGVAGGDYLALYGKLLGDLNVFDVLGALDMAPRQDRSPYVTMAGFEHARDVVFNSNTPEIPVTVVRKAVDQNSVDSYTYSVDGGFWRTPVADGTIKLATLTEGEHELRVRAINDSLDGAMAQKAPTTVKFRVDTLAPEITVGGEKGWGWWRYLPVKVHDLQTPDERVSTTFTVDTGGEVELEDGKIPLRRLGSGRHVIRIRAFDEAGNEAKAAKELHIDSGGCNSAGGDSASLLPLALTLGVLAWRRRASRLRGRR